uniref:Layilin a n=1 Tax=Electrophorus electricus TaxID=8005 RepID=A0A4W4GRX0_ELEEL
RQRGLSGYAILCVVLLCCCSVRSAFWQRICKRGTDKPCYKIAYFQDIRRKVNFEEATRSCRSDGGELLSIESSTEQRLIEGFIQELKASDGDFWIGLRREPNYEETIGDCASQYYWLDSSRSDFRSETFSTETAKFPFQKRYRIEVSRYVSLKQLETFPAVE